jgi:hypothetical protein
VSRPSDVVRDAYARTTWEYRVTSPPTFASTQQWLDDLGRAGWELVTVAYDGDLRHTQWVFKRARA